jgi:hypothetical protein
MGEEKEELAEKRRRTARSRIEEEAVSGGVG